MLDEEYNIINMELKIKIFVILIIKNKCFEKPSEMKTNDLLKFL